MDCYGLRKRISECVAMRNKSMGGLKREKKDSCDGVGKKKKKGRLLLCMEQKMEEGE